MLKFAVLAAVIAVAASQMNPAGYLAMMRMMGGQGSSGSSGSSGGSGASGMLASLGASRGMGGLGGMARMMNNPIMLCRQTDNFRLLPCRNFPQICDMTSMTQYKFPGLMKCSPMGMGCCLKDIHSLMIANQLA